MTNAKTGLDVLSEYNFDKLSGKNIGVITNHSGINSHNEHIIDLLLRNKDIKVKAIFGPEHGIRGNHPDGSQISSSIDEKTGISIYSLYGTTKKPSEEMLEGLDALVFDIQDAGVRFYTYLWTMALCMESAGEHNIEFYVLDRPNPITAEKIQGNLLDKKFSSFVGLHPILLRYGMTIGELALLLNGEGFVSPKVNLNVIAMRHYKRCMWFDETALTWLPPSPNLPTLESVMIYPGLCFFEGTNVSEGRGTEYPFESICASWLNEKKLADDLNKENLLGTEFIPIRTTPIEIPGKTKSPKYNGEVCGGIRIIITNRDTFDPINTALTILIKIKNQYPDKFKFSEGHFDHLAGSNKLRNQIEEGLNADEIINSWEKDIKEFKEIREKYILYKD